MSTRTRRPPGSRRPDAATPAPIQIVVTPGSGDGTGLSTARELRDALAAHGRPVRLEAFRDLDRLHRWAKANRQSFSAIVCVGGDATQSTTALVAVRQSVPFVTVPRGFGNLFAHAFNQPETVEGVLDLLARGRVIHADVGACNGELFLCQQSYGLIAEVQQAVESAPVPRARTRRWLAYYRTALRQVDDEPPTRFRVVVDGRVVAADAALVIVANVKSYGAWLPLTPDASPVDGLFDVFIMRGASRRHVFLELLRRHLHMRGVNDAVLCRGRRVSVSRLRSARDRLEILPHRLPIVVAPETAARLTQGLGRRQTALVLGQAPAARGTRQRGSLRASTRSDPVTRMAPGAAWRPDSCSSPPIRSAG